MTLASQNIHFLNQGRELLERLDKTLFQAPGRLGGKASTGAHMRHCIDYYRCFLCGASENRIDYDARQRDPRLETAPAVARDAITEIIVRLERLEPEAAAQPLRVKVDAAAWDDPQRSWSHSSIGRELQFLLSHTVHHYALIAMILRDHGFEPGEAFGVAPSTLEYRGSLAPCAQ